MIEDYYNIIQITVNYFKICCLYSASYYMLQLSIEIFDIFIPFPNSSISFEIPNVLYQYTK